MPFVSAAGFVGIFFFLLFFSCWTLSSSSSAASDLFCLGRFAGGDCASPAKANFQD